MTDLPLKLSSATLTRGSGRYRDLEPDHLVQLELSISARVLGGFDILLATTDKSGGGTDDPSENIQRTERLQLHVNSIMLSSLPRLIHLSGRSLAAHRGEAVARSYTLKLIFSNGSGTAWFWSPTFEVPRSPVADARWHLTLPFGHSLTSAPPPHAP